MADQAGSSGTIGPAPTIARDEPEPESTITRLPFRVRYFGDYELKAEIAHGGMGVVYLGRQVSLDRPVALKMILPNRLDDEAVKRFRQEAESAGNLDHPNIVQVYEVGKHEGQHFLSMKLIEGRSLKEDLPRLRNDPRATARLMATVARAVHHAHQRGVLHRDLKPQNILVDRDGQPHVTDFGLAKRIDAGRDVTQTGAWAGTPEYMPPEQARGEFKGLTTAADIYSLGAILYTLLTGEPPFRGAYPGILRRISEDEPARPRALDRRVDPDLETICLKCVEKAPERRYPTAGALADDLDRWLAGKPITARPVSRRERAFKWVRRNPAVATLSAAVLLIGLAGLAGVLWQWRAAIDALKSARQIAYPAHISLAQREWDGTNVTRARQLLENPGEVEFRGFEWHYLKRLYHPERLTLNGRSFLVTSLAFSPDGKRLATAITVPRAFSPDGKQLVSAGGATIKLWEAASGKDVLTLDAPAADVFGMMFLTIDVPGAGTIQNQKLATPAEIESAIRNFQGRITTQGPTIKSNETRGVAFSPDGKHLAAASASATVKVWDAATGQVRLTLKGHTKDVLSVAFSPDGTRLVSASADGSVKLWDAASGQELRTLNGHKNGVESVAFRPDGKRLASSSGSTVKLWDATGGQELRTLQGHTGRVTSVAFSPDGNRLASASADKTVRLWNATTGAALLTLKGQTSDVQCVTFRLDGEQLASAGRDRTVRLWEAASGRELVSFKGHAGDVRDLAFSPDGSRLASAGRDQTVRLWDATAVQESRTIEDSTPADPGEGLSFNDIRGVAFSPDGRHLASSCGDRSVRLRDAKTGQELRTLKGHDLVVTSVAFSPGGDRLASGSEDQTVKLWDAATGRERRTLKGHTGHVRGVAFSPDGKRLASASADNTTRLWDVATGQELFHLLGQGSTAGVTGVAFSPDGKRLAASGGVTVWIWDSASGRELLAIKVDLWAPAGVAFSPDGKRLAAPGKDATVKVWNASNGQELITLKGHTVDVVGVAFSPDGKRLASASRDGTVKLWDTATGQEMLTLKGRNGGVTGEVFSRAWVLGVAFSPEGKRLASVSRDHSVWIWLADER